MADGIALTPLHELPRSSVENRGRRLILLSLIKNECDIIAMWTAHVCSLFDEIYVVDHMSTDGTREYLLNIAEVDKKLRIFAFDNPAYYQQEITNKLAEMALENNDDCWLFALDADEFLEAPDSRELRGKLDSVSYDTILEMCWKNCLPLDLRTDRELDYLTPFLIPPTTGVYKKVAMHSRMAREHGRAFSQGNHEIVDQSGNPVIGATRIGPTNLLHVPLRSVDQFALKCVQGFFAYTALPSSRAREGQGFHWFEMFARVTNGGHIDPSTVREFAIDYGIFPTRCNGKGASVCELTNYGWRCSTLNIAHKTSWPPAARRHGFVDTLNNLASQTPGAQLEAFIRALRN